jgi:hypothetical protein
MQFFSPPYLPISSNGLTQDFLQFFLISRRGQAGELFADKRGWNFYGSFLHQKWKPMLFDLFLWVS